MDVRAWSVAAAGAVTTLAAVWAAPTWTLRRLTVIERTLTVANHLPDGDVKRDLQEQAIRAAAGLIKQPIPRDQLKALVELVGAAAMFPAFAMFLPWSLPTPLEAVLLTWCWLFVTLYLLGIRAVLKGRTVKSRLRFKVSEPAEIGP